MNFTSNNFYLIHNYKWQKKKGKGIPITGRRPCRSSAVRRWLPTAAARVRVWQHVGFVVDKAALGQVLSEYFGFPCQSFHQFLHYHNLPGLTQ
jgi:hypothetical protein